MLWLALVLFFASTGDSLPICPPCPTTEAWQTFFGSDAVIGVFLMLIFILLLAVIITLRYKGVLLANEHSKLVEKRIA